MASSNVVETTVEGAGVDEAIGRIERLYQTVTGREAPPPETAYAPIPVERDPAEYVDEQLNRLLDLLAPLQSQPGEGQAPTWAPPLTVCESGTEIVVRFDLPGVTRDQVEVTAAGSTVTVTGTRSGPTPSEGTTRHSESRFGSFRRTIVVPGAQQGAELSARMKDGVLELRVPRASPQPPAPKSVPVN